MSGNSQKPAQKRGSRTGYWLLARGLASKVYCLCDAAGLPLGFHLTGGEATGAAGGDIHWRWTSAGYAEVDPVFGAAD